MATTEQGPKYRTSKSHLVIKTYHVDPENGSRAFRSITTSDEPIPDYHNRSAITWPACRCQRCPGGRTVQSDAA